MKKKKILVIVLSCLLLVAIGVGATFAIWGKDFFANKEATINSNSWNETEKYITFSPIFAPNTQDQTAWSVVGLNGSVPKVITIPSKYKISASAKEYPVTEISGSFSNFSGIKQVNIPKSVTKINANAFTLFKDLVTIEVETGTTFVIGDRAFNACEKLKTFKYPGSKITSIGEGAFVGCIVLDAQPIVKEG